MKSNAHPIEFGTGSTEEHGHPRPSRGTNKVYEAGSVALRQERREEDVRRGVASPRQRGPLNDQASWQSADEPLLRGTLPSYRNGGCDSEEVLSGEIGLEVQVHSTCMNPQAAAKCRRRWLVVGDSSTAEPSGSCEGPNISKRLRLGPGSRLSDLQPGEAVGEGHEYLIPRPASRGERSRPVRAEVGGVGRKQQLMGSLRIETFKTLVPEPFVAGVLPRACQGPPACRLGRGAERAGGGDEHRPAWGLMRERVLDGPSVPLGPGGRLNFVRQREPGLPVERYEDAIERIEGPPGAAGVQVGEERRGVSVRELHD